MARFSLRIPHSIGQEDATERLIEFSEKVRQDYQDRVSELTTTWQGNTLSFGFSTLGLRIHGDMTVESAEVTFDGELPRTALMFKGAVEKSVRQELAKLLA